MNRLEAIDEMWRFLAPSEVPLKSDVLFVFGGLDLAVPRQAASLYRSGFASQLLITGNAGLLTKDVFLEPECIVFRNEAVSHGVPLDAIITEDKATNTGENVEFGMSLLRSMGWAPHSALLVAKPFLMRRCLATFEKKFPNVVVRPAPPEGPWSEFLDRPEPEFVARLVAELDRLRNYSRNGFIAEVSIPDSVIAAEMLLREAGK